MSSKRETQIINARYWVRFLSVFRLLWKMHLLNIHGLCELYYINIVYTPVLPSHSIACVMHGSYQFDSVGISLPMVLCILLECVHYQVA